LGNKCFPKRDITTRHADYVRNKLANNPRAQAEGVKTADVSDALICVCFHAVQMYGNSNIKVRNRF
jgi:hypothetical protein